MDELTLAKNCRDWKNSRARSKNEPSSWRRGWGWLDQNSFLQKTVINAP